MAERLTNVELLIMLSEDVRASNQDWSEQVWKEGEARAKNVQELIAKLDRARSMLMAEYKRLSPYLPQEPMPKIATQGPRQDEPLQRKANS